MNDEESVHGLNLEVPEDAASVIKPWDEREDIIKYAESGVDDQLVIHVPFIQNVKVKSMLLKLGKDLPSIRSSERNIASRD